MTEHSDNFKGGLVMLIAVGSLSVMDACLKVLSSAYPPLQVAALRALASLPVIVVWIGVTGGFGQLFRIRLPLHLLRGALGIFMLSAFVYGVRNLPLSAAYTIFYIAPMLITMFAALILRERIEWQRWAAIVVGLLGVLVVLRPTGTRVMTAGALAVLLAAIAYAFSAITVRILGRTDSTQSMVFWLMVMIAAGGSLLALPQWRPIQQRHAWIIAGVALAGFVGQWTLTEAFRIGESSFIAPFEYTSLAWGVALDWFFWRAIPAGRTFAGAAVIIACGIYLIRRERTARSTGGGPGPTGAIGGDAAVE
jgi:drug/metabolite transporter (DMT)-like permease